MLCIPYIECDFHQTYEINEIASSLYPPPTELLLHCADMDSSSIFHRLPEAYENLTLGMLFGDIGLSQLPNMTMDNLTEHLNEHFMQHNLGGLGADDGGGFMNLTTMATAAASAAANTHAGRRDPLTVVLPVTICYALIFVAGVLGNVITCAVISRNKSMHTATNYYLFNLAISDLILLLSGEL